MNGFILINKEKNLTSHDVVKYIKQKYKFKKVGHSGTLDPFATGLMIVGINHATKMLDTFLLEDKKYKGTILFGISTNTYDITGKVINKKENFTLNQKKIAKIINKNFRGKLKQKPPIFSAIKYQGKKLYQYGYQNKTVKLKKRDINIFNFSFKLIDFNLLEFEIKVSSGTYIRSIAHDLGKKLKIPACLNQLERISIKNLNLNKDLYKIDTLINYPSILLNDLEIKQLFDGKHLELNSNLSSKLFVKNIDDEIIMLIVKDHFNLYKIDRNLWR